MSGAGWLIDLFPCGTRVNDNDPLVTVALASRLQSALHLSRSLYGQKTSKHTHTHTCHVNTTVGHGCAHKQTSHSTKDSGELKQILREVRTRDCFLCYTQSSTNTRVSAAVKRLTGSQSPLNEDARENSEPSHLEAHRTQIEQLADQYVGFVGVS